jgi:toxin ParE1/3/4
MKVRYTTTALGEIDDILTYIAKDNPLAADEVSGLLDAMIARIADYPRLAIETDVPGVHVVPLLPYKYLVFYNVQQESVIIRNVQHAARARLY